MDPKRSGQLIASLANHVKIHPEGVERLGEKIKSLLEKGLRLIDDYSEQDVHPKASDPNAIDTIFVLDTLNFCFWTYDDKPKWTVDGYTGYFSLCAAIKRAAAEGFDISNPKYYSQITEKDASKIFRGDNKYTNIPLFEERIKCLHEVGNVLLTKFDGSFLNCVKQSDRSATRLLDIIVDNFPCFRDRANYKGHNVTIYKRAQILVADVWSCFKGKGLGEFKDIDKITMFADYRVPQVLIKYGVLEYSEELNGLLKANTLLENGCEMEVEIRGCSIHAVELVKEWLGENCGDKYEYNSILIDQFLWGFRREKQQEIEKLGIPFHKTISIYY